MIEALDTQGVIRHTYKDWLAGRAGEMVWLGRLRKTAKEARAKIRDEAAKHIRKPYDFWSFDLDDDRGLYCSKLAWLSIFRSLKIAVDGNPNPKRAFWFSPKQLLYLATIDRLHDPGPYAV